ncbi:protease prsW family [Longilinea arvoryzae]|uniref:Protease prsW family n=1 Tax=Longilinea arvoryzae TaxID=360412 RepID=A0A0S7BGZ6_9CHLR|nr:PrsW family glutamic-type intramembrane protease [Longilinea arvoryzae]GAP13089.1 protease prsW family [Longilinea arvoryzae]
MPSENRFNWGSFGQLLISLLGILFGLGGAGLLALLGVMPLIDGSTDGQQITSVLTMAWGGLLVAAICLPSAVLAVRSLMGHAPWMRGGRRRLVFASLLLLLWPLALVLANATAGSSQSWLFLPPLLILVVGIPVFWLTSAVRSGLPPESAQRTWGVASFGLVIGPPLNLLIQIAVLLVGVVGFGVYLAGQPGLLGELQTLSQSFNLQSDPNRVLDQLRPYLEQPGILTLGMLFISGLVPLIEELFKPLGVWFLAGRKLTPAAGFAAGALSGGMFALLESLGYLSSASADGFITFALARTGTMLLHVTTAGLVGWGLGSALGEKRYLRLGLTYLGAVVLHSLWNTAGILPALVEIPFLTDRLQGLATASPYFLGGLSLIMVVILVVLNRRLRAPAVEGARI